MPELILDMDGVVADWMSAAIKALGFELRFKPHHIDRWNVWECLGVSQEEFYKPQRKRQRFWIDDVLPYEGAQEFVITLETYAPVRFCTANTWRHMRASSDKMHWLRHYFGPKYAESAIITSDKYMVAAPDRLLIDDTKGHISDWIDYGGQAVLFPRSWNTPERDFSNVSESTLQWEVLAKVATWAKAYKEPT